MVAQPAKHCKCIATGQVLVSATAGGPRSSSNTCEYEELSLCPPMPT